MGPGALRFAAGAFPFAFAFPFALAFAPAAGLDATTPSARTRSMARRSRFSTQFTCAPKRPVYTCASSNTTKRRSNRTLRISAFRFASFKINACSVSGLVRKRSHSASSRLRSGKAVSPSNVVTRQKSGSNFFNFKA